MPVSSPTSLADLLINLLPQFAIQFGAPEPKVTRLPTPSFPSSLWWEHSILEQPWILILVLLASGVIGYALLSRLSIKRAGLWALLALALGVLSAVGVYLASVLVTTEREALIASGEAMMTAATKADHQAVAPILAGDLTVTHAGNPIRLDRARLLTFIQREMASTYLIKERSISSSSAVLDGASTARTQHRVTVTPEFTGFPNTSWWMLSWRKNAAGVWQVTNIDAQQIEGIRPGVLPGL